MELFWPRGSDRRGASHLTASEAEIRIYQPIGIEVMTHQHPSRRETRFTFVAGVVLLLLTGCMTIGPANDVQWIVQEEEQRDWPTREFGFLHVVDGFAIYELDQLPPCPYDVLGILRLTATPTSDNPRAVGESLVVKRARQQDGQAALISKKDLPAADFHVQKTDYLVIKFKTNRVEAVFDRLELILKLTAEGTNGYTGPDGSGGTVHYTADELAELRKALDKARQTLLAPPERAK